jgi:hypothetical protein
MKIFITFILLYLFPIYATQVPTNLVQKNSSISSSYVQQVSNENSQQRIEAAIILIIILLVAAGIATINNHEKHIEKVQLQKDKKH